MVPGGSGAPKTGTDRGPALLGVFCAGLLVQTVQIVLARELFEAFSGAEIVLGVVLAAWMLLVAAGGAAASAFARTRPDPDRLLALALGAGPLPLAAAALLSRTAPGWLELPPGQIPGLGPSLLITLAALAPAALYAGALFVLGARALESASPASPGNAVGTAYMAEAGGAALAGAAFSFLLVEILDPFRILGLVSLASAAPLAIRAARRAPDRFPAAAAMLAAGVFLLAGGSWDRATTVWRHDRLHPGASLIGVWESRHGRIIVTRTRSQTNYFVSGHLAFSLPDRAGAAALAHAALSEHPDPRDILLVGGGVSGLVRESLKHGPRSVATVEFDPVLVQAVRTHDPLETAVLDDPRVSVAAGDGRAFVKRAPTASRDLVLVSVPDPRTAGLNRYYTREFFEEAARVLRPDGILALTLSGAQHYLGDEILARNGTVYHTLLSVFPHVLVWPGDPQIFFAAREPGLLTADPELLSVRFILRDVTFPWVCPACGGLERPAPGPCACGRELLRAEWFTPHHFDLGLEPGDVAAVNRALRSWPRQGGEEGGGPRALPAFMTGGAAGLPPWEEPVPAAERRLNSDRNPAAVLHDLLLWNRRAGEGGWGRAVRAVAAVSGLVWIALCAVFLAPLAGAALLRRRLGRGAPRRAALAAAVAAAGYAVLAFELVVILSFQSQVGDLYRELGVLFGAFMLALGAGSFASLTWIPARPIAVPAVLGFAAALGAALPFALGWAGGLSPGAALPVYILLVFVSGVPVGLVFPLCARLYAGPDRGAASTAGVLYGADLLGAVAGALLVGPLLLPVLGLTGVLHGEVLPLLLVTALVAGAALRRTSPNP